MSIASRFFAGICIALLGSACSLIANFSGLEGSATCATCDGGVAQDGAFVDGAGAADSTSQSDSPGGAGITLVTSVSRHVGTNTGNKSPTSLALTLPVAPQANDTLLAVAYADSSSSSATAPAGWTSQTPSGIDPVPSGSTMYWFSRTAAAAESTTITFSFSSTDNVAAAVAVYRGVSSIDPASPGAEFCGTTTPLPAPLNYSPTPTTCSTPSITTSNANERVVLLWALDSDANGATPTWNAPGATNALENKGNVAISDFAQTSPGATSIGAATHSQTPGYAAVWLVALAP